VYQDGRVLFNTESCTLFALDARTGRRLWKRYLGDPTLAQVAAAGGLVYAAHPGQDEREVMLSAYRVTDGEWVWSRYVGKELLAAPVVHGGAVYAANLDGALFRFDAATGKRSWYTDVRATTAPWIAGDEVFVSRRRRGREEQVVLDVDSGKLLRTHHAMGHAWDVPRSAQDQMEQVWAFEGSRPVVAGGVRYVAMAGEVRATDAATGAPLWARRYAADPGHRSLGTVALAGPQVVVSTRAGQLYGVDVDTGYTLWAYDLAVGIVAQPIVARGWIYVTTATGYVIALHVADESLDGWHMFGGNPAHDGPVTATDSA
ncbi:MAG TPA: PQQ-binding-like beta-propeller repeat protein, partial [Kofleriaceae bacterium]|nr:PQQ-binding-like beta-propeller repeat protein [Kofleriaceae bacterium]